MRATFLAAFLSAALVPGAALASEMDDDAAIWQAVAEDYEIAGGGSIVVVQEAYPACGPGGEIPAVPCNEKEPAHKLPVLNGKRIRMVSWDSIEPLFRGGK